MWIISQFSETFGTYWIERSPIWFAMMLIAAVAAMLFIMWSLYLLIRFAISFHKAARQMKTKWRRDDRALTRPGTVQ
jgi:hypothetical protein